MTTGTEIEAVFIDVSHRTDAEVVVIATEATTRGIRVFELERGLLEKVSDAQTPQPVLATVRMPIVDVANFANTGLVLVLHDMRDPGNAGTVIRSADAAGASGVVLTGQSVDPYNPKTLRATAGSIFQVPVAVGDYTSVLRHFSSQGKRTYATVVTGGTDHRSADLTNAVVVIGNESQGLTEADVSQCDEALTIAMAGHSESLNAGVAASLLAFESLWQRRNATTDASTRSLGES